MTHSPPPLSPSSHTSHSVSAPSIPILPHSIIAAAHCLAPLDDLHLAHLINELKPPLPVWSIHDHHPNPTNPVPVITPNDRLRSDELADLPAPEAERLHAAYDIEDYLDSTPDRLLVYGPSTPIIEILHEVKQLLIKKNNINPITHHHLNGQSSLDHSRSSSFDQVVYVARVSFQPNDGPDKSYKWEKGGPDLIRFELDSNQTLLPHNHLPIVINWSPIELALSQALEVSHQLLALLHSRQFVEILSALGVLNEFRPINPIVWLVDPVEYAHAQLRETTEWGWSEHHVELNSLNDHQSISRSTSAIYSHSSSSIANTVPLSKDYSRPLSKSHLSHELRLLDEDQEQVPDSNQSSDPSDSSCPVFSTCPKHQQSKTSKNLADDLPNWLIDLLDNRLPRLLSLPDGCLSYELLNSSHPSNPSSQHIPLNVAPKPIPSIVASPPEKINTISPDGQSSSIKLITNSKWTTLSALATPTRVLIPDQRSLANSVPSFDQHHLLSPSVTNSLRHVQTNTLKYYPCKACSEHAFKLALSHKLNEEKRRLIVGINNNRPGALSFQAHNNNNNRRGSKNVHSIGLGEYERSATGELIIDPDLPSGSSTFGISSCSSSSNSGIIHINSQSKFSQSLPSNNNNTSHKSHQTYNHQPHESHQDSLVNNNQLNTKNHVNDDEDQALNPSTTYPVIGLGLKGKAIKEAMDREHDEFINNQKSLSSILGFKSVDHDVLTFSSKHTWDEGEVIED